MLSYISTKHPESFIFDEDSHKYEIYKIKVFCCEIFHLNLILYRLQMFGKSAKAAPIMCNGYLCKGEVLNFPQNIVFTCNLQIMLVKKNIFFKFELKTLSITTLCKNMQKKHRKCAKSYLSQVESLFPEFVGGLGVLRLQGLAVPAPRGIELDEHQLLEQILGIICRVACPKFGHPALSSDTLH